MTDQSPVLPGTVPSLVFLAPFSLMATRPGCTSQLCQASGEAWAGGLASLAAFPNLQTGDNGTACAQVVVRIK